MAENAIRLFAFTFCLLLMLWASPVTALSIGLFSDADASSCRLDTPPGETTGTVYIFASQPTPGPMSGEMRGAEFRVDGLPSGWSASWSAAPAAAWVIGDPFGDGANIGFDAAQVESNVLLFTAELILPSSSAEATLRIATSRTPYDPGFQCPVFVFFGIEAFRQCADGGSLSVNSSSPCTVGVNEATWGGVKALYD